MSFVVDAAAYDRFMGRWSAPLAPGLADLAGIGPGQRVLDVGAGTGALSVELARRVGVDALSAVEPSPTFVAALAERLPGVDVQRGTAERLPHPDDSFDAVLAQLVVHFMEDPVAGLREMARVSVPGGVVAACVWDHDGGRSPLSTCWEVVRELDPAAVDESGMAGARAGHLVELFTAAGLADVEESVLTVETTFPDVDEWWEPYGAGVGPLGDYLARLDDAARGRLKDRCAERLGPAPFTLRGTAWAARGRA